MKKLLLGNATLLFTFLFICLHLAPEKAYAHPENWLARSERLATDYATDLGKIFPEWASQLGLTQFDELATQWSPQLESKYITLLQEWRTRLTSESQIEKDEDYRLDLDLLKGHVERELASIVWNQNTIPFFKATDLIYNNIFALVNPQTPMERRKHALDRFHRYLLTDVTLAWMGITKRKITSQPQGLWPFKAEVEHYLENSPLYLVEIAAMLKEAGCGCDLAMIQFREQVKRYDDFIRNEVLTHARENPSLPRAIYLQKLRANGVEWSPEMLIERAKADYDRLLPEFLELARQIGQKRGLPQDRWSPRYVSEALRADSVKGTQQLLEFTKRAALHVEEIIQAQQLISLPDWPTTIRLSTPAENAVFPYPHVNVPPALGRHAQKPEYVFPVTEEGLAVDEDSHYWSGAVTLAAHEARPGHELQYSRQIAEGSRTRVAFGTSNAYDEGWGVYVEHLLTPFYDTEARYGALQSILFRTARAFLDPMVQLGQADESTVMGVLAHQLGLAESFVAGEYSRYSWRDPGPGQATSYYYGMRAILDMKENLKAKMGATFTERWFNDSILEAGPMPYRLCEKLLFRSAAKQAAR